jgi:hypothetical protein
MAGEVVENKVEKTLLNTDRLARKMLHLKVSKLYHKTRRGKFHINN